MAILASYEESLLHNDRDQSGKIGGERRVTVDGWKSNGVEEQWGDNITKKKEEMKAHLKSTSRRIPQYS